VFICARASSIDTPGFNRPMTDMKRPRGSRAPGGSTNGTHASTGLPTSAPDFKNRRYSGGITPTTVLARALSRMVSPRIDGFDPKSVHDGASSR
jgi:hypothetical protein